MKSISFKQYDSNFDTKERQNFHQNNWRNATVDSTIIIWNKTFWSNEKEQKSLKEHSELLDR